MGILHCMPSGRTHLRIEIGLFVATAAAAAGLGVFGVVRVDLAASFLAGDLFSVFFLSPDLDLRASRPMRRWGPLRVLWIPYAAAFRHRRLSHHPLLGPTTRLAYLGAWVALIAWLTGLAIDRPLSIAWPGWPMILAFLVGAYLPNEAHIAADWMASTRKRTGSRRH